jgi:hypothetical protein
MRLAGLFLLSMVFAAVSFAQDTNFASGPQYLVTTSSPLFLRPIATPSLSLNVAPVNTFAATEEEVATESPVVSSSVPAQAQLDLARVYWGDDWVRHVTGQNASTNPSESEIEITSPQTTPALPASIVEAGVTRITDEPSLRASGYGLTLGEVSAYWKARRSAPRVYTNADIARLHGS